MHHRNGISSNELYQRLVKEILPQYDEKEARQLIKILLQDVTGVEFEKIMIDELIDLNVEEEEMLNRHMQLLKDYHPIQYILGRAHFFGRDFSVNKNVLIPRQETEELVNEIIIDNKKPGLNILDIGSGSGCIGITLGLELKNASVTLLDIDADAMDIAMKNAKRHELNVKQIVDDILRMDRLPEKYDIIVSNPPYVTEREKKKMLNNVLQHEPSRALFVPDEDPLLFYRTIISIAKRYLVGDGKLYFEINENYGSELVQLCEQERCSYVHVMKDLNGKDRILKAMFG